VVVWSFKYAFNFFRHERSDIEKWLQTKKHAAFGPEQTVEYHWRFAVKGGS